MKKKEETLPQIEGYEPVQKTISMTAANIWGVAVIVVVILVGMAGIKWLYPSSSFGMNVSLQTSKNLLLFCLLLLTGIVVHELVHGITWLLMLKERFSHLTFGFLSEGVYCHIDVPMKKKHYVTGALMPLLLVGVVPWVAGIATGSMLWMMLGSVMIGAAEGDWMIVRSLRKVSPDAMVYDHPSLGGCYVYCKKQDI